MFLCEWPEKRTQITLRASALETSLGQILKDCKTPCMLLKAAADVERPAAVLNEYSFRSANTPDR